LFQRNFNSVKITEQKLILKWQYHAQYNVPETRVIPLFQSSLHFAYDIQHSMNVTAGLVCYMYSTAPSVDDTIPVFTCQSAPTFLCVSSAAPLVDSWLLHWAPDG